MNAFDIISGNTFSDAVRNSGTAKGMYKRGVNVRYMNGKEPVRFRLLPAFDRDDPNPESSVAPWVSFEGKPNDWLTLFVAIKFLGAKQSGREWGSMVSRESIGEPCVYRKLWNFADKDPDWKYLTASGKGGSAILPLPRKVILMNILDIDQPDRGAQLGEFSQKCAMSMYDPKEGFMWSRNPRFAEEANELNYMDQYTYSDLSDPQYGLVLRCERRPNSQFQAAYITTDVDDANRPYRWPVGEDVLAGRQDLTQLESFLNIPTEEETVETLTRVLTQRSPKGYPETALLQELFGDMYKIPQAASAPGAVSTVQGFTAPDKKPDLTPPTRQAPPIPPAPEKPLGATATWVGPETPSSTAKTVAQPRTSATPATAATTTVPPIPGIPGEPVDADLFAQLKNRR